MDAQPAQSLQLVFLYCSFRLGGDCNFYFSPFFQLDGLATIVFQCVFDADLAIKVLAVIQRYLGLVRFAGMPGRNYLLNRRGQSDC